MEYDKLIEQIRDLPIGESLMIECNGGEEEVRIRTRLYYRLTLKDLATQFRLAVLEGNLQVTRKPSIRFEGD